MELASESRLSILMTLRDRHSKLSTLARTHSTSVQDVFRNMNRLTKEGLVKKKDADGLFCLSHYIYAIRWLPAKHC
jgi:predicted transcriptional regulator